MKQKRFTFFLALIASAGTLFAQTLVDGNYYTYDEETHGMAFIGCYHNGVVNLTIPPSVEIDGKIYSVTKIGYQACKNYINLKSVSLPSTIVAIEGRAFEYCSNLSAIQIPSGVKRIGLGAFGGCSSLSNITIPSSVTSIGDGAFGYCRGLKYIVIPDNVTSLGTSVFAGCTGLEQATIGSGLSAISYGTFRECTNLKNVIISNNISSIGEYAFNGCSSLPSITIEDNIKEIGKSAFHDCENLETVTLVSKAIVSKDYEYYHYGLISMFDPNVKKYVITEGITHIGNYAFDGCNGMESVVLPNSLLTIGYMAFCGCQNLLSVSIPGNVTSIGDYGFKGCKNLESVEIGSSVTNIGNEAFSGCDKLSSIFIPNHVSTIGVSTFSDCNSLSSVTLGNSVNSIGASAFVRCNIHNINFTGTIAEWCSKSWLFELTEPAESDYTLFINGSKVENLVIPEGVPYISTNAFHHYTGLTSIHIPSSVDSIATCAFWNCTGLESIRCDAVKPPVLDNGVFTNVDHSIPVYVPAESIELYKTDWRGWSVFFNILPINGIITTVEEINDNHLNTQKILRDGQVYIERNGKVYTLQGQETK